MIVKSEELERLCKFIWRPMMRKLLVQMQLSNYNARGKFDLACDSGFNMCMGRIRVMLELDSELQVDIILPHHLDCVTDVMEIYPELFPTGEYGHGRVRLKELMLVPNAAATRYDFDYTNISRLLQLRMHRDYEDERYTHVYINDPMLLRHYKAAFYLEGGYKPKFITHSHFIDNPQSPKFPAEVSLWHGQVEAAIKSDYNFWQCESSMNTFFEAMSEDYSPRLVELVRSKSTPWDDGYSTKEINTEPNKNNIRFSTNEFSTLKNGKVVIFVPNRVGDGVRSSDYTRCGKYLFEVIPELWRRRQDFVVIAGNPNQKISNDEIADVCPAYVKLVPSTFNRDEYRLLGRMSDISVGLYAKNSDTYGGTAARELVDLGTFPTWPNVNEYASIASNACYPFVCNDDLSDLVDVTSDLIDYIRAGDEHKHMLQKRLRDEVVSRCSYESTTPHAMKIMGLGDK
jgi:hypothetical protein